MVSLAQALFGFYSFFFQVHALDGLPFLLVVPVSPPFAPALFISVGHIHPRKGRFSSVPTPPFSSPFSLTHGAGRLAVHVASYPDFCF